MRIFPPQPDIGPQEGFAPEKDLFKRADIGAGLTSLVTSVNEPLVVAVDAQWGSGKTVFLQMWAGELRKAKVPVIFFDAFENDYVADAFTAIAGEIVAIAEERKKADTPATKRFAQSAANAGRILLRSGLKIGVKLGTLGALESADLEDVAGDFATEASRLTDQYLGELITKRKQEKAIIHQFRDALASLPTLLGEEGDEGSQRAKAKPLVIIIDELDRCRPLFALEILERIKHFFSVPNVHFVLGCHVNQLSNSVKMAYGPEIDAHAYLQKFIHITVPLVRPTDHRHESIHRKFLEHVHREMQLKEDNQGTIKYAFEMLSDVAEARNFSLRAVERIISVFALATVSSEPNTFRPAPILMGLCILKVDNPRLYEKAQQGSLTFEEISNVLAFDRPVENRSHGKHMVEMWRYCTSAEVEQALLDRFGEMRFRYNLDERLRLVPFVTRSVIDRIRLV